MRGLLCVQQGAWCACVHLWLRWLCGVCSLEAPVRLAGPAQWYAGLAQAPWWLCLVQLHAPPLLVPPRAAPAVHLTSSPLSVPPPPAPAALLPAPTGGVRRRLAGRPLAAQPGRVDGAGPGAACRGGRGVEVQALRLCPHVQARGLCSFGGGESASPDAGGPWVCHVPSAACCSWGMVQNTASTLG